MVKNLPPNAGDMGSIHGWGTKIPHAAGQLSPRRHNYRAHALWSPWATREKPKCGNERAPVLQLRPDAAEKEKEKEKKRKADLPTFAEFTLSFLFFGFWFFGPCHAACRILVPLPGIEPGPSSESLES